EFLWCRACAGQCQRETTSRPRVLRAETRPLARPPACSRRFRSFFLTADHTDDTNLLSTVAVAAFVSKPLRFGGQFSQNTVFRLSAFTAWFIRNLLDRKSTRLNSSHSQISYAVFCL